MDFKNIMVDLSNYMLLGFDFRLSGNKLFSVDACIWEQAEDIYQHLLDKGCIENPVQLLNAPADVIEENTQPKALGVAIAVSESGLQIMKSLFGNNFLQSLQSPKYLINRGWEFQGFDVADANGYFSVFDIDSVAQKITSKRSLFLNEREAEMLIEPAARVYPSHAPFIVFAVLTYRYVESR